MVVSGGLPGGAPRLRLVRSAPHAAALLISLVIPTRR